MSEKEFCIRKWEELKLEYKKELLKIDSGKFTEFKSVGELEREIRATFK